jgi:hypothetical protein
MSTSADGSRDGFTWEESGADDRERAPSVSRPIRHATERRKLAWAFATLSASTRLKDPE